MKNIPLDLAIKIIGDCTAVQVDDDSLVYPRLFDEEEAERVSEGLFLLLTTAFADERFAAADNETVAIDDSGRIVLINTRGEKTTILPLVGQPVSGQGAN